MREPTEEVRAIQSCYPTHKKEILGEQENEESEFLRKENE